jgi:alanine dehydrogenase
MTTLFITRKDVARLLDMPAAIEAVEQAFRQWDSGRAQMPPKAYLVLDKGDFRAMPAALPGAVGIKWVNVHPGNPAQGLPTVMAVLVYNHPDTGYPLAVMDATEITALRTGATAAVASRYLARADSHTLGLIGAGRQSYTQLTAHAALFKLEQVRVYDRSGEAVKKLIDSFPRLPLVEAKLEEAAASDIICTVTPVCKPLVRKEWVLPGTHINAIGADAEGKEELEPSILGQAVVVVDNLEQAAAAGEINVPLKKGLFESSQVYATLAEIVSGRKPGRRDSRAVTVFDSTGVAIEDVALARLVYEKACNEGGCLSLDFIED